MRENPFQEDTHTYMSIKVIAHMKFKTLYWFNLQIGFLWQPIVLPFGYESLGMCKLFGMITLSHSRKYKKKPYIYKYKSNCSYSALSFVIINNNEKHGNITYYLEVIHEWFIGKKVIFDIAQHMLIRMWLNRLRMVVIVGKTIVCITLKQDTVIGLF